MGKKATSNYESAMGELTQKIKDLTTYTKKLQKEIKEGQTKN